MVVVAAAVAAVIAVLLRNSANISCLPYIFQYYACRWCTQRKLKVSYFESVTNQQIKFLSVHSDYITVSAMHLCA